MSEPVSAETSSAAEIEGGQGAQEAPQGGHLQTVEEAENVKAGPDGSAHTDEDMGRPSTAAANQARFLELSVGQEEEESEEWDLIPKGMVLSPVASEGTPLGSPSKSITPKLSQIGSKIFFDDLELPTDNIGRLSGKNLPAPISTQEQASTATQEETSSLLHLTNSTITSHDPKKKGAKKGKKKGGYNVDGRDTSKSSMDKKMYMIRRNSKKARKKPEQSMENQILTHVTKGSFVLLEQCIAKSAEDRVLEDGDPYLETAKAVMQLFALRKDVRQLCATEGSSSIESLQQLTYQISEVNASEKSPALNEASSFVHIRDSSELHDTDKYKEALQALDFLQQDCRCTSIIMTGDVPELTAALKVAQQTANAHTIARLEMVIKQKTPKYNWMLNQQKRLEEEKMREKLTSQIKVEDLAVLEIERSIQNEEVHKVWAIEKAMEQKNQMLRRKSDVRASSARQADKQAFMPYYQRALWGLERCWVDNFALEKPWTPQLTGPKALQHRARRVSCRRCNPREWIAGEIAYEEDTEKHRAAMTYMHRSIEGVGSAHLIPEPPSRPRPRTASAAPMPRREAPLRPSITSVQQQQQQQQQHHSPLSSQQHRTRLMSAPAKRTTASSLSRDSGHRVEAFHPSQYPPPRATNSRRATTSSARIFKTESLMSRRQEARMGSF